MDDIKKEVAEGFEKIDTDSHMEATTTAFTEYVAKFIARRFPEGLPEALTVIVSEIILDAFEDGAAWSDREAMRQDVMVAPRQVLLS